MFSIVPTMRGKAFGPISCRSFFISTVTRHPDRFPDGMAPPYLNRIFAIIPLSSCFSR
jgi:hypothetical protein